MCDERKKIKDDDYILGCGVTRIDPLGTGVVQAQPTKAFTPYRIIIPDNVAASIVINWIRVNNKDQLISSVAIPGVAFMASVDAHLKLSTVTEKDLIKIGVTNLYAAQVDFTAAIIGKVLQ